MKFEFASVSRIVFGTGQIPRLGELTSPLGRHALLVFNGRAADRARGELEKAGVRVTSVRQTGEPTTADVDAAVETARREGCDMVVGVGGGSAIDCAKAVAGLATNGGVATDYMEVIGKGLKITRPALPWIAVPTTAGTGAEATRNAVVGAPQHRFKASIRSELLLPRAALVDPELQLEVPQEVTAASGMDALCQCIESYTSTGASLLTDPLALEGVRLAGDALPRAFRTPSDLEARSAMAAAALLSGLALTNAGLGAVHGFAAPIGANFPVPHGVVCAALLAPVMAANIDAARREKNGRLLRRYAQVGRALTGDEEPEAGFHFAIGLLLGLGIPPLSKYGMTPASVPELVGLAKKSSSMRYNPVRLSDESLSRVLLAGIEGRGR